jgi:hypothetical protein
MTHISTVVRPSRSGRPLQPITPQIFPNEVVQPIKMMQCEVVFGAPSMNCNGTGICRITGTTSFQPFLLNKDCRTTLGHVSKTACGKLSLFFFRELLCIHLFRQHFHKGVLVMDEACPIPEEISIELNFDKKQMQPGKYTIHTCDGYFRVEVDCV